MKGSDTPTTFPLIKTWYYSSILRLSEELDSKLSSSSVNFDVICFVKFGIIRRVYSKDPEIVFFIV